MNMRKKEKLQENLREVLALSKKAAQTGYKDASRYLDEVEKSINAADEIISKSEKEMSRYHINDPELVKGIKDQLRKIQTEFYSEYESTRRSVEEKKALLDSFNITLFGKTMTGKSTLYEILTHGDGATMGHGGQRTTRDIHSYEWQGMAVTDVPGVEAYEGKDDEELAEKAVANADLVLFMITAGQPEGTEADWLVKLKQKDKPLICICNYKKSIADEQRLKRMLNNPERLEKEMDVAGLVEQFNQFIQTSLPNERVDFLVTHLLAKFYSQQPQYREYSQALSKLSRFDYVENAIIDKVVQNGIFYRRKSFLSIVDIPIYEQSVCLFDFSAESYGQFVLVNDKMKEFGKWCDFFNQAEYKRMHDEIDEMFNSLDRNVSGFVEDHVEDSDAGTAWQREVERFGIQERLERILQNTYSRAEGKIKDLFEDLQQEMNLSCKFSARFNGDFSITNWKKGFEWASAITGVGALLAGFLISNPVGWVVGGIAALLGVFGWFARSRERKLRENRQQLTQKIREQVGKMREKSHGIATKWYYTNIKDGIMKQSQDRLRMIRGSFLGLANSERQLALGYSQNHIDISKNIIMTVLDEIGAPESVRQGIYKVARIPSKKIIIVTDGTPISYQLRKRISMKIGNNEEVRFVGLDNGYPLQAQVYHLFKQFRMTSKPRCMWISGSGQMVVYIDEKEYSKEEKDNIILIQQILNVHVIKKDYEYQTN